MQQGYLLCFTGLCGAGKSTVAELVDAAISPYAATRARVRAMTTNFVEAFVDAPLGEVIRRDVKGFYARALTGEIPQFTGVCDPCEAPVAPELYLRTDQETPEESAARVLAHLEQRGWVASA